MNTYKFGKRLQEQIKDYRIAQQLKNHNYIEAAHRARRWIERNTIQGKGIVITSKQRIIYQEVTGYYIPTLLQWGMREKAVSYAEYLCDIQEKNGAWLDGTQSRPSVFNTGQVLRGLYAICEVYPRAYEHLIRGCDWLLSNMNEEGRLVATTGTEWSAGYNSELIHLYCLPPLYVVGQKYGRTEYLDAVEKIKNYYLQQNKNDIENFNFLSHFYAYVLEALVDLGETEIVHKAMSKIRKLQKPDGSVPAFKNCNWTCSTGLFQLAIVWFKLGDWKHGNRAFDYAVGLQNKSGGWYGGYPASLRVSLDKQIRYALNESVAYFPDEEISWAVKYFFDALYYREKVEFEKKAHTFITYIDSDDDKYQTVYQELKKIEKENHHLLKVADIGCGKGRYLKKMMLTDPQNEYYGIDLSQTVLSYVRNPKIHTLTGNILNTGCSDSVFDLVYAAESVEHAVFIDLAVRELCRITKPGGGVVIIDKDKQYFDKVKYQNWIYPEELSTKQWLDTDEMIRYLEKGGLTEINVYDLPSPEGELYKVYMGRKV